MASGSDHHLNIIDTPGYADFISEAKAALRVSDAVVAVVDSVAGVEIGTERTWNFAADYNLPRVLFINKMDRADADADQILEMVQERFGRQVVPLQMTVNPGEGFNHIVDLVTMKPMRTKMVRPLRETSLTRSRAAPKSYASNW